MQQGQNPPQTNREAQRNIQNQRLCVISVSSLTLSFLMFNAFYQHKDNMSLLSTYIFYLGLISILPASYGAYTYYNIGHEGNRFFGRRNQNNVEEPNIQFNADAANNNAQQDNDLEQNLLPSNNP